MTPRSILLLGVVAAFAVGGAGAAQSPRSSSRPVVTQTESRGAQLAEENCAACHAVESAGVSPNAFAPPFRNLRMRYSPITLERHIAEIAKTGFYGMPAQRGLSQADAEALAAYIEQLRSFP